MVVARLGLDVPFASGMVERALAGTTALLDAEDGGEEELLGASKGDDVAGGGARRAAASRGAVAIQSVSPIKKPQH